MGVDLNTTTLTFDLHAPGMTMIHRAGLGGLACSLKAMERDVRGKKWKGETPGGPWKNGSGPPWKIDETKVTLDIGEPEAARAWLKSLFEYSFQVQDELFFLPGQYRQDAPAVPVRAYLQLGITLTFLQHGRTRQLAKEETTRTYNPEDDPKTQIEFAYKALSDYKHRTGWKDLTDNTGRISSKPLEVVGPLSPGAVVRHNAFSGPTKLKERPGLILPLYFAIVGCLPLSINRGSGVLLVPDVDDLTKFPLVRQAMTPTTTKGCQVSVASDATLQAQLRVLAEDTMQRADLPGCHVMTFKPTPWASQQKSRVSTEYVNVPTDSEFEQFKVALSELPPRIATREFEETKGRGKNRVTTKRQESFWVDSIVRPLVATNLARGRPWYHNFVDLFRRTDPVSKRPLRTKLRFEKKGLSNMVETIPWSDSGESAIVRAVHASIRRRYAIIADENKNNPGAMKNRWKNEYDRWRLAFAGAKTSEQFRKSLCDLFSRAGVNKVLQEDWQTILPLLADSAWQQTRDLALLGLASYSGRGATEIYSADGSAGEDSAGSD